MKSSKGILYGYVTSVRYTAPTVTVLVQT